uniref:TSA: Wollemia nobilis Ref_Wollemi_Transcript_4050_1091 transcribed RNA sequence n=1 Tax=Wollemia nobilis TaxID=56998 RepID=A0A0C9QWK2_9CONI
MMLSEAAAAVSAVSRHCYPSLNSHNHPVIICHGLKAVPLQFRRRSNAAKFSGGIRAAADGDLSVQRRLPAKENVVQTVPVEEEGVSVEGVIKFDKQQPPWRNWRRVAVLVGGDVLALLTFAAIGRINHGMTVLDWETLNTVDPFVAGWLLSAYFLGGYESEGLGNNGVMKAAFVAIKSWTVGIPLGLAIRGVSTGHFPASAFILVSMGSTLFLLVGWRTLFTALFPNDEQNRKKREVYKQGSPLEFFELLTSLVRRW